MAYERNDFRSRDDRWRDRDRSYAQGDDRGFFDRAGDEVRSWFGDDEAERRRETDARRYERERGYRDRDFDDRWRADYGRGTGGGFGNQRGTIIAARTSRASSRSSATGARNARASASSSTRSVSIWK